MKHCGSKTQLAETPGDTVYGNMLQQSVVVTAKPACRNKCLNHLLDLANAHVESVILDAFYAGVAGCVDPDARKALKVPGGACLLQEGLICAVQHPHPANHLLIA